MKYLLDIQITKEILFVSFVCYLITVIYFINHCSLFSTRNLALICPIFFLLFYYVTENLLLFLFLYEIIITFI